MPEAKSFPTISTPRCVTTDFPPYGGPVILTFNVWTEPDQSTPRSESQQSHKDHRLRNCRLLCRTI
jgi:hypothetical protein